MRVASQRAPGWTFGRVIRALDRRLGSTRVYGRIVCVSQAVQASFNRYPAAYRAKLCVVHNGVEWKPAPETRHEARRALGLARDAFIHVAIGRLTPQKNYSLLIEAFTGVPEGLLVIAGDGPLRASLEAQVAASGLAGRVIFLGAIDRAAVRRLLRAADVFVQPSLFEGQSNAVLEAMHAALPIVASDIAEQRETLVDPESGEAAGLLVPPDDALAWTRALSDLHANPQWRASLAAAASERVERRFGLNRMIDGFEAALGLS